VQLLSIIIDAVLDQERVMREGDPSRENRRI